jgi:hypothetical protein
MTELWIFRTPDVVEFAVSPQVGQAVLAFARSDSSSGPKFSAGGQAALPAPPAKLSPSKGMTQPIFPARQKLQGDIRSSDLLPVRLSKAHDRNAVVRH